MVRRMTSVALACFIFALAPWPTLAAPAAHPSQSDADHAQASDNSFGEANADWWQWLFSVPTTENPANPTLPDNSAVNCRAGQSGDVWFLASRFLTGGSLIRTCTIPEGKALVVPLINSWVDNVCNSPPLSVEQLRDIAASTVSPATKLHASVDGRRLEWHRAISPVFSYTLPSAKNNLISDAFGVTLPGPCWPSLTVRPAVADGFYTRIPALHEGTHMIRFGGSAPGITLDVTYVVTVRDN